MIHGHGPQPTLPADSMRPAWRAACIAYREVRQKGHLDHKASSAARDAVLALHPEMSPSEAQQVAIKAVAYAAINHSEWMWRGVGE